MGGDARSYVRVGSFKRCVKVPCNYDAVALWHGRTPGPHVLPNLCPILEQKLHRVLFLMLVCLLSGIPSVLIYIQNIDGWLRANPCVQ